MELESTPFYTRANLEIVLGNKKRTLDARILALKKKNKLITIKSGFYLNNSYYQQTNNKQSLLEYLSGVLVSPSYISLEYALSKYGFLAESVYAITCITTKKTRSIKNIIINYNYRTISKKHFHSFDDRSFNNFQYSFATLEKAIWDLCYLTPLPSLEYKKEFLFNSRFNWDILTKTHQHNLTQLLKAPDSPKMTSILNLLTDRGVL